MADSLVTLSTDGPVALVTIDNPPANLLSTNVLGQLEQVLDSLEQSKNLRVAILNAKGRFFCPGADVKEFVELTNTDQGMAFSAMGQRILSRLGGLEVPVIAALSGPCLGGGLELAMACHIRVAAAGISLGLPEIKLGLIPGFGGTQRLPRLVGPSKAIEMILTGELITSEEGLVCGLITKVVPGPELLSQAKQIADRIASKGRQASQAALQAIRAGMERPLGEGFGREATLFGRLFETSDMKEGVTAFLEKRPPSFTNQ